MDFPRPGNNNSYDKCRRRWDLLEDKLLRYQHMYNLDKAMLRLANAHPFLNTREVFHSHSHSSSRPFSLSLSLSLHAMLTVVLCVCST